MPLCLAGSRHKGQSWKASLVRFVDTDSGFCFWLMEQEIQTCRFNRAWKRSWGVSPSIHSLRRGFFSFFLFFFHCFLSESFSFFYLSLEIRCFASQRSAGLCLHLHMLSSDVDTRSQAWKCAAETLRHLGCCEQQNDSALSGIPSEVPPLASGYIRHLVCFFVFFILSSAGIANTESSFNIDVLNGKKGNHVCFFFPLLASEIFAIAFHSAITPRSVISPMSLLGAVGVLCAGLAA